VAVSHHDTTPLSGEDSVHHLRGRNRRVGHVEGTGFLSFTLPSPILFLPRFLVLAGMLVVVTGARVAPGAIACDAEGALAAGTTTWIMIGPGNGQPAI
jgi:hypothetical protein